jgi:hypothetical protein
MSRPDHLRIPRSRRTRITRFFLIGRHHCRNRRRSRTDRSHTVRCLRGRLQDTDPCAPGPVYSRSSYTPDAPPISRPLSGFPASVRRVNVSLTLDREEVTCSLRQDCVSVANAPTSLASSSWGVPIRPPHLLPPLPIIGLTSSTPRNNHGDSVIDSLAPTRLSGGRLRKGRRPNHHRGFPRPQDIPRLDYGLPGDFGERVQSRAVVAFR